MLELDDSDLRAAMMHLARAMKAEGVSKSIKRNVSKELRQLMQPMVQKRRAAVLALPSKGHSGDGMRQAIARKTVAATRWSGKNGGISIIQRARGMPREFNMAGRAFNRAVGWNPTTLGGETVHQQMNPVLWFDALADSAEKAEARHKIIEALDKSAVSLADEIRRIR